jgi:hypothetical protein
MKPFVVMHRATVQRELIYYGYDRSNVLIFRQRWAFMTRALFLQWTNQEFFPAVLRRRREFGYKGSTLLLLDGLGCHQAPEFLRACEREQIRILPSPPHSSDQLQPLDLLTFALLKHRFSSSRFNRCESAQSNKIIRMLGAVE